MQHKKIMINHFGSLMFIEYIFSSQVKTTPVPIPIFLTGFIDYWSTTTLHCYTYYVIKMLLEQFTLFFYLFMELFFLPRQLPRLP
jgi:hypothetical protein